ncbi:helix-turn-helix domain-containing protein [Roseovarius sp. S1116L3]|uniref:helix-turn-helix domain-containing protein n=1 Tax=Roseovarius roseus TaxID=3342636 RepID=UPI003727896C
MLSDGQRQVVALVLKGHSTEAIALKLDISADTVKVHRRHAYAKRRRNIPHEAPMLPRSMRVRLTRPKAARPPCRPPPARYVKCQRLLRGMPCLDHSTRCCWHVSSLPSPSPFTSSFRPLPSASPVTSRC